MHEVGQSWLNLLRWGWGSDKPLTADLRRAMAGSLLTGAELGCRQEVDRFLCSLSTIRAIRVCRD